MIQRSSSASQRTIKYEKSKLKKNIEKENEFSQEKKMKKKFEMLRVVFKMDTIYHVDRETWLNSTKRKIN